MQSNHRMLHHNRTSAQLSAKSFSISQGNSAGRLLCWMYLPVTRCTFPPGNSLTPYVYTAKLSNSHLPRVFPLTNDEFQAPLGVTETYQPQAMMESSGQRLNRSSKVFVAIVAVYVVLSGYLLFSMNRRISELQQDWAASKAATAQLRNDIGSTGSETQTLASRLGLTQKQLESRAAALRKEQQQAEERLSENQKQQLTAVSGEVAGVKTHVGAVESEVTSTRSDLEAVRGKLERAIGDLGVQSGLIAHTRDELDVLKHKGDRNYYEFTLAKNSKHPTPVGTVSLQLRKTDAKRGKYTMNVQADDRTIEKKDRNLNEPVQFYTGKDRFLYELVVYALDKDKVTGYLSTPKTAPAPFDNSKDVKSQ